jgi:predicted lipid-binding transport protein (Tim44 family)
MSDGFAYIDILFFAMVAAFIALRLRSVLGRRTGHERRRSGGWSGSRPNNGAGDNVVALPDRSKATETEPSFEEVADERAREGLVEIHRADPNFDLNHFLAGARAAFEMIVEAFSAGDKNALRPLLEDDVFEGFARAIDQRDAQGHVLETQLKSVRATEVAGAALLGPRARVTIRFVSDQINVMRDAGGNVIEGDPSVAEEVVDLWAFERDTRSPDPNWLLAETRTPQ